VLQSNMSVRGNPLFVAASKLIGFGSAVGNTTTRAMQRIKAERAAARAAAQTPRSFAFEDGDLTFSMSQRELDRMNKRLQRRNAAGMTDAEFIAKYL